MQHRGQEWCTDVHPGTRKSSMAFQSNGILNLYFVTTFQHLSIHRNIVAVNISATWNCFLSSLSITQTENKSLLPYPHAVQVHSSDFQQIICSFHLSCEPFRSLFFCTEFLTGTFAGSPPFNWIFIILVKLMEWLPILVIILRKRRSVHPAWQCFFPLQDL